MIALQTDFTVFKEKGGPITQNSDFSNEVREEHINYYSIHKSERQAFKSENIATKTKRNDTFSDYTFEPYQKIDHYVRDGFDSNTQQYWGFDSENNAEHYSQTNIIIQKNAVELLREKLSSPTWKAAPIMLCGNSDCYQSLEESMEITRELLKVLWEFRHPVQITTKNALILRDLDILRNMAQLNLVHVNISMNTLDDRLREKLEPNTSSIFSRLRTIKHLSAEGIPVSVLVSPIIPGLTDHEIMPLVRTAASNGARNINYITLRLEEDKNAFKCWLMKFYPNKYDVVMDQINNLHTESANPNLSSNAENFAEMIKDQFRIAKKIYFKELKSIHLETAHFNMHNNTQLSLF